MLFHSCRGLCPWGKVKGLQPPHSTFQYILVLSGRRLIPGAARLKPMARPAICAFAIQGRPALASIHLVLSKTCGGETYPEPARDRVQK